MKNYIDLEVENLMLRELLENSINDDDHSFRCASVIHEQECDCWILEAKAVLEPPKAANAEGNLSRSAGNACETCKHPFGIHNCKVGSVLECSKANCACSGFVDSGVEATSHW